MAVVIVTGSAGLIGSETAAFYAESGYQVVGIDNNMRQTFFGAEGSTLWNRSRLIESYRSNYEHYDADIRNALEDVFFPDRIVVGTVQPQGLQVMRELYHNLIERVGYDQLSELFPFSYHPQMPKATYFETDAKSAELIKYAANAFLAVKISYINEMARLCEVLGGNVRDIAEGMGLDTRIGKKFLQVFLRKTSMDELPQLINILRGEMSFVGPRPEQKMIVEKVYSYYEKQRWLVKPGITGLWQISPDRNKPIHENLHHDFSYIQNLTFALDVKIVYKTIRVIVRSNTC